LHTLAKEHPEIGEIRGLGLMTAVDIVTDHGGAALDTALRDQVVERAFRRGLLLLGCGESAIRFCPPLCITARQIDVALQILGGVLSRRIENLAV
jgi:4-aminobutyrate aminotransferase